MKKITRITAFLTAVMMMVCAFPALTISAGAVDDESGSVQLSTQNQSSDGKIILIHTGNRESMTYQEILGDAYTDQKEFYKDEGTPYGIDWQNKRICNLNGTSLNDQNTGHLSVFDWDSEQWVHEVYLSRDAIYYVEETGEKSLGEILNKAGVTTTDYDNFSFSTSDSTEGYLEANPDNGTFTFLTTQMPENGITFVLSKGLRTAGFYLVFRSGAEAPAEVPENPEDGTFLYNLDGVNHTAKIVGLSSHYDNTVKDITIGSSVEFDGVTYQITGIGERVFKGMDGLNITVAGNITIDGTYIDDGNGSTGAFSNCSNITVTFKGQYVTLGGSAFQGCKNLKVEDTYSGSDGSIFLGQKAFAFVSDLKLTVGSDVKVTGDYYKLNVFQRTSGTLTFLGGVENIGGYSFIDSNFSSIITTPKDTYNWGDYGLYNPAHKAPVTIKANNSDSNIGWNQWNGISSLTVEFDDPITDCPHFGVLGGNGSAPVVITFEKGVSGIPANTFKFVNGAAGSQINIKGDSVTVEDGAFPDNANLTVNFEMPRRTVKGAACLDALQLTTVTYQSVEYHDDLFSYNLVTDDNDNVMEAVITGVYSGYTGNTLEFTGTTRNEDAYPVNKIAADAFRNNSTISAVTFTNTNEIKVKSGAFRNMTALQTIAFNGTGLVSIGESNWDYTFGYNRALTDITAAEDSNVTFNVMGTFYGCSSLKNVTLGNINDLHQNTFIDNNALETFEANNITEIGQQAFNRCTALRSFKTKGNITTIKGYAFDGSKPLTNVLIGGDVGSIEGRAFGSVNQMDTFIVLGNAGSISNYGVFSNTLRVAVIKGTLRSINYYAFGTKAFTQSNSLIYVGGVGGSQSFDSYAFGNDGTKGKAYFNTTFDKLDNALTGYSLYIGRYYTSSQEGKPDIYLRIGGSYGYGTSATDAWNTYTVLMYKMYNQVIEKEHFAEDCTAAGVNDLGLEFSGDLPENFDGFTIHILAEKNTDRAILTSDMYGEMVDYYGLAAPATFKYVKALVFEEDVRNITIPDGALSKFPNLESVTIKNPNAKVTIGKNAFKGTRVHTICSVEQTVESNAGTVTLAGGAAPIGTELVMTDASESHNEAVIAAARKAGMFEGISDADIQIHSYDLSLVAPNGETVNVPAKVSISQKLSVYGGADTIAPQEFGFFHINSEAAELVTNEFTANAVTGQIQYGFDATGFSPYAAAYYTGAQAASDGVFTYLTEENGNATIIGYDAGFIGSKIAIPAETTIDGTVYKVVGIAENALTQPPEGITITSVAFLNEDALVVGSGAMSGLGGINEIAFEGTGNVIFTDGTAFNGSGIGIVAVTMPNGLTAGTRNGLCGEVFSGITDGYTLTVDNISSIPDNMFRNDTKLTEVTILSALKNISKFKPSWVNSSRGNFKDCAIGTSAFEGAENLTSFTVAGSTGESIAIGNEAFMNCTSLTELNIADKISGLGDHGLSNTGFTELTLYTDNAELGKEALAYNQKLEKLEIIGGVYGTGSQFLGGTGDNATMLRQLVFDGSVAPQLYKKDIRGERLEVLIFKNGGSNGITDGAIYTEGALQARNLTVYVDGKYNDNPYIRYDGFPADQQVRIYLNFPTTSEEAHQTNNLIGKANIADVVYAMDGAPTDFYLDTSLKEDSAVSFNSLEKIKEAADQTYDYASKFRGYFREAGYDPSDLEFRDGEYKVSNYTLHVIGATDRVGNALAGDERVTEVEIKLNSGRSIVFDDGAFKDCTNLSDLTFTTVKNADIGKNAFENCTKLSQVKAYNKYDFTFREESFKGCSGLNSLYIYGLDNVNIYADAFAGTAITELNIRYNYVGVMISDNAFRGMTGLESVVIDNKNNSNKISIGENAFADCGELKEVSLKKSEAPTIATNAFSGTTIDTLRIDGGSTNVADGACIGGKTYIDGGKTFNANLARKIGNFENIILTNAQTISKDAQVFAGNENLKIVYLGKDSGISGIGGAIFDGMPETAAAFVAHKQTDFTSDTKPEREDGELHFLDNVTVKYIDGTNNKANPDGSENNGFRTFAQAKAYTEKIAEQNEQKRTSGSDTYYYTEAAKILRKALTAAGVSFTENDIRFPLATEEADSAVFYVIGTVNIRDNETWESPEGSTMMLLRNEGFTAPMVSINSGKSLSLSNVVLDGVNIPAAAPLIQGTTGATLNINEGAVICNNNRTTFNSYPNYAGGIYISGTVNMTGGTISGNRGTYGGGIQVCGSSTSFFMSGGVIEENVAFDNWSRYGQCSYGGGVNVGSGAKMYMSGGEIRNNQAIDGYNQLGADGGGIAIGCDVSGMCQQAKLYMTGGTISGNYAEHDGGGIYIQDNCEGHFTGGLIEGNTANTGVFGGGGIYVNGKRDVKDGIAYLEYVLITGNSAKEEGGGLAGCSTSTSTVYAINGGAIYGNHSGDGSDIYTDTIQRSAFPSLRMTGMISSVMFNGAPYNWTDSRTGEKLTAVQLSRINNVLHDSMVTLTANPDGSQPTGAPMIIRNNVSNTKGGGIGSNGSVIIGGTPESQEVTWKPSASKILWNRNMKEGETFTFKVYKENASQGKNFWWTVYEDEAVGQGTVTGGRDGQPKAISFDTINLGEMYAKDIGKTFTYLVAEVDPHDENMIVPGTYLAYTVAIVTEWDDKNKKETLGTDILRIEKGTILADGSFEFDNEFDGEIVEEAVNNNNFGRIRTEVTAADTVFHNYSTKTELSASKQWLRYNGSSMPPDGAKVVFELYADGMATGKTIELDGRADPSGEFAAWTATWKDLDVYRRNADGLFERNEDGGYIRIEYAVKEISVTPADRFSVIEELIPTAVNAPAVFLNKETGSFTERTVRKEWDDDGNRDGMRPTSIVTTLTADGAFVQQVTLSDANGWAATVRDLPVNKDGKAITYAWTEQEVSGYTQEEVETTGTVTVFTNRVIRVIVEVPPEEPQPEVVQLPKNGRWIPGMIFDDYLTPLGGEWLINHVGDCFD